MKFTKVIVLSLGLLTVAGAYSAGWLDSLTGNTAAVPAQKQTSGSWFDGLLGGQKPAAAPTQLGMPAVGSVPAQAAEVGAIRQNITAMISKVQEMAPAITKAVTNKDFTSAGELAGPAKDLLTLGMSTAKSIQQAVAANPQMKGVFSGLVNQLTAVITPVAAQIRTISESAGWGTSFVFRTIASGLEQIPQLLNSAIQ